MTVSVSAFESVPAALPVAMLVTEPVLRSACVIVYVAVQVTASPGSRKASWLPTVSRRAADGRLVVGHRDRAGETHVAGVGDEVAVGDRLTDRR